MQPEPELEVVLAEAICRADAFSHQGKRHNLSDAAASRDLELSSKASLRLHELGQRCAAAVLRDPRFPGNMVIMLCFDNNGWAGFYPSFFGDRLLLKALATRSPAEAISWLQKVLNTQHATGRLNFLFWGGQVDSPAAISDDIAISPLDNVADDEVTRWVREKHAETVFSETLLFTPLNWALPTTVLSMRIDVENFAQREPIPDRTTDEQLRDYNRLTEVFSLLPLAGPCAPILAASWSTLDDPDLSFAARGPRRSGRMHEIFSNRDPVEAAIDAEQLARCFSQYVRISSSDKRKMQTALKRLVQARLRHRIGDKAVELCTAIETLAGDEQPNEISHKVATRLARFVGGSLSERQGNFRLIKKIYEIRSKMVHRGVYEEKGEVVSGMSAEQAIEYTIELAMHFMRTALDKGGLPEWREFDVAEQV